MSSENLYESVVVVGYLPDSLNGRMLCPRSARLTCNLFSCRALRDMGESSYTSSGEKTFSPSSPKSGLSFLFLLGVPRFA